MCVKHQEAKCFLCWSPLDDDWRLPVKDCAVVQRGFEMASTCCDNKDSRKKETEYERFNTEQGGFLICFRIKWVYLLTFFARLKS